jgi:hypothetical protein
MTCVFFLNHLSVSCRSDAPLPLNSLVYACISKNMRHLLHDQSKTIKIRQLTDTALPSIPQTSFKFHQLSNHPLWYVQYLRWDLHLVILSFVIFQSRTIHLSLSFTTCHTDKKHGRIGTGFIWEKEPVKGVSSRCLQTGGGYRKVVGRHQETG